MTNHIRELFDRCRARWPKVRVLESAGPPGLSGARNTALETCATEDIEYLDDEAVAIPGWLAALLGACEDDRVLATGNAVLPGVRGDFTGIFRAAAIEAGAILTAGSYSYATASLRDVPPGARARRSA